MRGAPDRNNAKGSQFTLDESGISSKASTDLDDSVDGPVYYHASSAPSTPHMLRNKPPPKPPRMRSYLESSSSTYDLPSPVSPPTRTSPAKDLSRSSLADVTNTFDATVAHSSPDGSVVLKEHNPQIIKDKIYQVLVQAKDFLQYELDPEEIIEFLKEKGAINDKTEEELYKCQSKKCMCEMLLDIITSKGHEEFLVLCEALRTVSKQTYLADLLQVLDSLFDIVTTSRSKHIISKLNGVHKRRSPREEHDVDTNANVKLCEMCACNNNESEDMVNDSCNFDIEIMYCDAETRQAKAVQEVANIKKKHRSSADLSFDSSSFLSMSMLDNANRYVPVIVVNLYNQCLRDGSMTVLSNILEHYSCIQGLSMAKNHMCAEEMEQLCSALQKNEGLVKLDIRLNSIGDEGAIHLANVLRRNGSLRTLNVTSTGLTGHGCSLLVEGLSRNLTLTELDIGFNDVQDLGCRAVAEFIARNSVLKKLRMRDNNITTHGSRYLFKALKRNSRLQVLDVSSNRIGNESLSMLSEVLLCNRTLKEINFERCRISRDGCACLARALKANTSLKILDLSMNPICDDGIEALSDGLKYNQTMDTLCLNMCNIGNKGFMRLLEALQYNCTMTNLKLCYNDIGTVIPFNCRANPRDSIIPAIDDVYEKLCQILQLNKSLKVLLWGNRLEGEDDPNPGPESDL